MPPTTHEESTRPGSDHAGAPTTCVGVIGLGYVGLPLAVAISQAGLQVVGIDVDAAKVEGLNTGTSHVQDVADDQVGSLLERGAVFTTQPAALKAAQALIIAVPSPLGRHRQPEMSYISHAADIVEQVVQPGMVVSLESTTYPGTTQDYLVAAVERAGLTVDQDVFVCFSPERVDPGNSLTTAEIPKVVGGVTVRSGRAGVELYRRFIDEVHLVSSARVAEFAKLLENTYRAVNIALMNELTQLTDSMDIDVWEVVDAAATKPFGFQPFYPGPGVGGHCIPLDPQFLAWGAREMQVPTRFIDLAESVNSHMPEYVFHRSVDLLNDGAKSVRGSHVLGVGLAYKPDIGDERESPALEVLRRLAAGGSRVHVQDDVIGAQRIRAHGFSPVGRDGLGDRRFDLAVVLTDHTETDWDAVANSAEAVLDCRGVYGRKHPVWPAHVVRL